MKNWTWQMWVGRVILLALSGVALIVDQLGVSIPLWMIILPAATQVAQWFLAWLPGTQWQLILGKGMLLIVAVVEIVLGGLGVEFEMWLVLVPMVSALAQFIISRYKPAPEVEEPIAA